MNNQDDQLHRLLQHWRDIEPSSNFEAQVWNRIKVGTDRRAVRPPSVADCLRDLLPQPVFTLTAATVAGVMIGLASGLFSVPPGPSTEQLGFLAPHTLAGALQR